MKKSILILVRSVQILARNNQISQYKRILIKIVSLNTLRNPSNLKKRISQIPLNRLSNKRSSLSGST